MFRRLQDSHRMTVVKKPPRVIFDFFIFLFLLLEVPNIYKT